MIGENYNINKVLDEKFYNSNLKERESSRKTKNGQISNQFRKTDEKYRYSFKNKYLPYVPCAHFGNEACDNQCPCAERGYCEKYCKCNKLLCKFSHTGCHCTKGDCSSNHCACYINARECDQILCKNCNKNGSKCKNKQLLFNIQAKIIVGSSKIAGWGLFANEDIKKDALIGEYKGELINEDITNKRDKFKAYENSTYMFTLDDEYTIDSRKMGNMLRYANHSKKNANAYPRVVFSGGHHRIGLFAKRHIYKGEEIKFDYDGQNILSKQFPWINDEKNETSEILSTIKKRGHRKKMCLISKGSKKSKHTQSSKKSDNKEKEDKNIKDKSGFLSEKKIIDENSKKANRIIRIRNYDDIMNSDNTKNLISLEEDKKKSDDKKTETFNSSNNLNEIKINDNIGNSKNLTASILAHKLLSRKRHLENDNNSISPKNATNKAKEDDKNNQKGIKDFFNKEHQNSIIDKDLNMLFTDKPLKLTEDKKSIINYDLGNIRVLINFPNPIIADFNFFGPKKTDFFKEYDILQFQIVEMKNDINPNLDNNIYGYLVNGNYNKGHSILVNYLKFCANKIYYYRNDNNGLNIYIFGSGDWKEKILKKCGFLPEENKDKLAFLIQNDSKK